MVHISAITSPTNWYLYWWVSWNISEVINENSLSAFNYLDDFSKEHQKVSLVNQQQKCLINGICDTFDINSNHFGPVILKQLKKFWKLNKRVIKCNMFLQIDQKLHRYNQISEWWRLWSLRQMPSPGNDSWVYKIHTRWIFQDGSMSENNCYEMLDICAKVHVFITKCTININFLTIPFGYMHILALWMAIFLSFISSE